MAERRGELADGLRGIGGVLLAIGAIVMISRRSGPGGWSDFVQLLAVGLPGLVLFVIAVSERESDAPGGPAPWRSLLLLTSLALAPVFLFLFLAWVGANTDHLLYDAAVFALTAVVAIEGGRRAGSTYAFFIAAIALLIAWLLFWLKVFSHPSADTARGILLAGGAVLLIAAAVMSTREQDGDVEVATAGGVAGVAAGVIGVFVALFDVAFSAVGSVVSRSGLQTGAGRPFGAGLAEVTGGQTRGWDIYLLLVSLGLLWLAARSRRRGPGYVGAAGILFFLTSIASQLTRLASGHGPSHSLFGWPVILVVLGVAGIASPIPLARRRSP